MGNRNYLFSIDGDASGCWYRLATDGSNHPQLFIYSSQKASESAAIPVKDHWEPVSFPAILTVWEPELLRVNCYIKHEDGVLHRYFQQFDIIPERFFENKTKEFIEFFLEKNNGFEWTDNGKRTAHRHVIQKFENGDWTQIESKSQKQKLNFTKLVNLVFNGSPKPLRKYFSPPNVPVDSKEFVSPEWIERRNQDLTINQEDRAELNKNLKLLPEIVWQLEKIVVEHLDFKNDTVSQDQYLLLLKLLLVGGEAPGELKDNPLLLHIARLRVELRNPSINFDKNEYIDAIAARLKKENEYLTDDVAKSMANAIGNPIIEDGLKADDISLYLMRLIAKEYENVSGCNLPPSAIDVNNLPPLEDHQRNENDQIYALYSRLLNSISDVSTADLTEILNRLGNGAANFPVNEYNQIGHWLIIEYGTPTAAVEELLLAQSLQELKSFSIEHQDFIWALLHHPDLLTSELIFDLAVVNKELALKVAGNSNLSKKLNIEQNTYLAVLYPDFAKNKNINHVSIVKHISYFNLIEYALEYSGFAIALLQPENKYHVRRLFTFDLMKIAIQHRDFALHFLSHRMCSFEMVSKLYQSHRGLEWDFLNQQIKIRALSENESKRLKQLKRVRLAKCNSNQAIRFITDPKMVWANKADDLREIVQQYPMEIATKICNYPEILDNLERGHLRSVYSDPISDRLVSLINYMQPLMSLKVDFLKLFTERPELFTLFSHNTLWIIAFTHPEFSMCLLDYPTQLRMMSGQQLYLLITRSSQFAKAFYQIMIFDDYTRVMKNIITTAFGMLAEEDDEFAIEFFRNRKFLPYLSACRDLEISNIIKDKPELALTLLQDPNNYLDDLNLADFRGQRDKYFTLTLINMYLAFAISHINIAMALLARPKFLQLFEGEAICALAIKHTSFALELPNHLDILNIICSHPRIESLIINNRLFVKKAFLVMIPMLIKNPNILAAFKLRTLEFLAVTGEELGVNFRLQVIRNSEVFSRLTQLQQVILFKNSDALLRNTISEYAILESPTAIRTAFEKQKKNRQTINADSFVTLRTEIVTKLMLYNLHRNISENRSIICPIILFSESCLYHVFQSQNKKELEEVLKAELQRIQFLNSFRNRFFDQLSPAATAVMWLKMRLREVKSFEDMIEHQPHTFIFSRQR